MKNQLLRGAMALGLVASIATAQNENAAKPAAQPAAQPAKPAAPAVQIDPAAVKTNSSYGFGYQAGRRFAAESARWGLSNDDIEREAYIKGFFDAFNGEKPQVEEAAIQAAMKQLGNTLKAREEAVAKKNLEAGQAFLAKNAKRKGVTVTDSGLQYEILKKGDGPVYKAPTDGSRDNTRFLVHYRGTLTDGTEFDASPEGRTVPMTLQVIPGFKEALTKMPTGSKWRIFIPANLAYGPQRRSEKIAPNSTLIFDLELVEIQKAKPKPAPNRAVSPPIQVPPPTGRNATRKPRAVSRPVRIPPAPKKDAAKKATKSTAVSPPVQIPPPPKKNDK
jgi:FKBP-type peptidyl-prolyl cis-trans isomerase